MAKMVGDLIWHRVCRDCCGEKTTTKNLKRLEKEQWQREVDEELAHGMFCTDYFCDECGGEDFDYYDASNLDGIKGVWTDAARLIF